jgi:hypothetical protein
MLRFGRHLWVRTQLQHGATLAELAATTGLSRNALRAWRTPVVPCACGSMKLESSSLCDACARRARTRWTAQALLRERDRFRAETGRNPRVIDWSATHNPADATGWPPEATVRRRFDTWAAFLAAE